MTRPFPRGFYGILSEPAIGWVPLARLMVARGVRTIQLRAKGFGERDLLALAREVRAVIPPDRIFIVNDHPRVALEVGADGVHLGQQDGSLAAARRLLGAEAIIGLSTHNLAQVEAANALQPSYIGVGPVFTTATKADAEPVIGLAGLASLCARATVPTVAIGGIGVAEVGAVLAAGPDALCAVGAVNGSLSPSPLLAEILDRVESWAASR